MPFTKGHTINIGRKLSRDTKDKISKAHKGMKVSVHAKEKISLFNKGRTPWNKGIRIDRTIYPLMGHFIGHTKEIKLLLSKMVKDRGLTESKSYSWKGDNVGYRALHNWVEKHMGKADHCGISDNHRSTRYHWANISREYKRDLLDWIALCPKCHFHFDRKGLVIPH